MFRPSTRSRPWPAWAGTLLGAFLLGAFLLGAFLPSAHAAATDNGAAATLDQAEHIRTKDHPRFVQMLAQLQSESPGLSKTEQWHLRYLQAWETTFEGNYVKSQQQLQDVIDHSGDTTLAIKASAVLLSNFGFTRRYVEAFTLANRLTAELPEVKDPLASYLLLFNLSQALNFAGQTELAIKYAHMMESTVPAGESLCEPLSMQVAALYNGKRLTASSPLLQRAIDTCVAAGQKVAANSMWLVLGSLYMDENQPEKTIALLDRLAPSISSNHFYFHMLSSQVERARAYAKLGKDNDARKAALAALAMSHPNDISEWLMTAYEVLYQVEKKQGHNAAALAYYEQYVVQDKGYLNDISARTLAYVTAQQQTLAQRLETERLSRENKILQLQQALVTKAVETGRLYIALLLLALVTIAFWLLRLKRSQLRFKRLARLDGLTGIFNHQHFIGEAERALRVLEKKGGGACLISIDLDHFKHVNDTHGHAIGDTVLKHTVTVCKHHLRPADLFGRLGGEEFGILLLDCSRHQGTLIADRIRLAIEATRVEVDGSVVSFSASIGLACTDAASYNLQHLCREADAALYIAKRTGRNRVIVGNSGDGDSSRFGT
ncbi:tetratricopeptide repeat-containing diguanylate cyclase [Dyella acidiphila]|uniref:diguanylate cyclase n=1 Tax=Dyella acidiphila TaxID=2775866 RepID=A0ABR9GCE1_9GAMM|nr:diguanylate cyclase [Dyella acidiphila]MBE1161728.1 diguanylate cyclase [Dyella acidiphila]